MKPIISPWLFYFADICSTISTLFIVLFVISLGLVAFAGCLTYDCFDNDEHAKAIKFLKISILCAVITGLIGVFCPKSETVYKMIIASQITEDNLNKGKESAKELVDYIIEKVDEMNKEE